jgi:hypothetical protein
MHDKQTNKQTNHTPIFQKKERKKEKEEDFVVVLYSGFAFKMNFLGTATRGEIKGEGGGV